MSGQGEKGKKGSKGEMYAPRESWQPANTADEVVDSNSSSSSTILLLMQVYSSAA